MVPYHVTKHGMKLRANVSNILAFPQSKREQDRGRERDKMEGERETERQDGGRERERESQRETETERERGGLLVRFDNVLNAE